MKSTVFNSLRHLRIVLGLSQKEMSSLAVCTRHAIESLEMGRLRLSTSMAFKISQATGCDYGWLMSNDESLPMINSEGLPYDPERDKSAAEEIAKPSEEGSLRPLLFYRHLPELQAGVAFDLLNRVLQKAQERNTVPQFIHRLEYFVRSEVSKFGDLRDEVYEELRKHAKEEGRLRGFLFPYNAKPFERGERRMQKARLTLAKRKEYVEGNETVQKSAKLQGKTV